MWATPLPLWLFVAILLIVSLFWRVNSKNQKQTYTQKISQLVAEQTNAMASENKRLAVEMLKFKRKALDEIQANQKTIADAEKTIADLRKTEAQNLKLVADLRTIVVIKDAEITKLKEPKRLFPHTPITPSSMVGLPDPNKP